MLTRFAPAPTGALHLGHVLNAIYVWDLARAHGAQVLLRIEDHDRERCRPEYEAGILDDLDWLGFVPDMYPDRRLSGWPVPRTPERPRRDLSARQWRCSGQKGFSTPATARGARSPAGTMGAAARAGLPLSDGYGWRVVVDAGVEAFDDLVLGRQAQEPSDQCGDVLIRDRRGNWTYQFAVSVDDWQQKVDLVIRGADLLDSTGRQIRLGRMLGRQHPARYAHHPLIMKSPDQKLSKSDGDTGVRDLRGRGWTPADVLASARSSISAAAPGAVPHRR